MADFKEIDLIKLANDGTHFAEKRDGVVRVVNSLTGKVVAVQNGYEGFSPEKREDFSECVLPDGSRVLVQKGLEHTVLNPSMHVEMQPFMIDVICQRIAEGGSLMKICQEPGMPTYNVLCKWRRQHDWINEALTRAKEDRAEYLRDKAVNVAETAQAEDPVDAAKLQIETYKWAAGIDNTKFSPRAKVDATINMPMQIIVQTGIDRTNVDKPRDVSHTLDEGGASGAKK